MNEAGKNGAMDLAEAPSWSACGTLANALAHQLVSDPNWPSMWPRPNSYPLEGQHSVAILASVRRSFGSVCGRQLVHSTERAGYPLLVLRFSFAMCANQTARC